MNSNEENQIHHLSGDEIHTLTDNIQLTVTSPPYLNAINYEAHQDDSSNDFRERKPPNLEDYLDTQEDIFTSVYNATQEGGYCAIVIAHTKAEEGDWCPLPHHFAEMLDTRTEWNFHERIIWNKVTGGVSRFGVTLQHEYPGYYYPNQMHEEIQIWRKGEIKQTKQEDSKFNSRAEHVKKEIANNVWHIAPEQHPCPFPEEIPHRLILLYSNKNDLVADPMNGIGTTAKVAKHLSRNYIGTDISEDYVKTARERIANEPYSRRQQLIPKMEKLGVSDLEL
jgi:site-specific DNA-methyltransferase (adenine-specific)